MSVWEMLICYTAGTAVGCFIGFKSGLLAGASATLSGLIKDKMLLHKINESGEIELIKPTNQNL